MPVLNSCLGRTLAPVEPRNWPGLFLETAHCSICFCASYISFSATGSCNRESFSVSVASEIRARIFKLLRSLRINSKEPIPPGRLCIVCSLAGRYDNPIPTRFQRRVRRDLRIRIRIAALNQSCLKKTVSKFSK
jgi:hypothetical protein